MTSILQSVKKALGLSESYEQFDADIMMHINSVLSILQQLGVGPREGFMLENKDTAWDEYIEDPLRFNMVKSYIYLKVRMLFDPPTTSYLVTAMEKQITEYEWRLNNARENVLWGV